MIKVGKLPLVLFFVLASILLTNVYARGDRKKNDVAVTLDECVSELLSRSVSLSSRNVIRIAVLPFIPTQKEYADENQFGNYFTEVLTSQISSRKEFKVFERNRLDAVTKELALNLSGLIDEAQAKKIGELAPIDFILTGTFTKLKSEVEINGRIIDVVTGEIDAGFSRRLLLSDNLLALLPEIEKSAIVTITATQIDIVQQDPCEKLFSEFRPLFKEKNYAEIAKKAITIPFTHECKEVHSDVLYVFNKERFVHDGYHSFIMNQIESASNPDKIRGYINGGIEYLTIDGTVDKEEWTTIVTCLSRCADRSPYLSSVFNGSIHGHEFTEKEVDNRKQLMNDYVNTVTTFNDPKGSSRRIMDFLHPLETRYSNPDLRLYFYWIQTYLPKLQDTEIAQIMESINEIYSTGYFGSRDTITYYNFTNSMISCTQKVKAGDVTAKQTGKFIKMLLYDADVSLYPKKGAFFSNQLDLYTTMCTSQLTGILSQLPDSEFDNELQQLCLHYGIVIPGKVPSIDSLIQKLTVRDFRDRYDVSEYLKNVIIKNTEYLRVIRKALERSFALDNTMGSANYQWNLVNIIVESRTVDPQIQQVLILCLEQPEHTDVPTVAMNGIGKMGKLMIPTLKSAYDTAKEPLKMKIIKSFGSIGPDANGEIAWLQARKNAASSQVLKDQIDDSIDLIKR